MRAGGHTSTRARQAAAGAAVKGFPWRALILSLFSLFFALVGSGAPVGAGWGVVRSP